MMNFKLSFGEPKYFVNEKKKIVTCLVSCRLKGADQILLNIFKDIADWSYYEENVFRFEAYATSQLDPADNFDPEIGKKVARAKAESMAYKYAKKQITKMYDKYNSVMSKAIENFNAKATNVIEHNVEYVKQF